MPLARAAIAVHFLFTVLAVVTTTESAAQPTISAPPDLLVREGSGLGSVAGHPIQLRLSAPTTQVVSVTVTFIPLTAESGQCGATADFGGGGSPSFTVTFAAGSTAKSLVLGICGDDANEGDERFKIVLSNPVNASIADGETTITIDDDDDAVQPHVYFDNAQRLKQVSEGDHGVQTLSFVVTLRPASTQSVQVTVLTSDSTAIGGSSCTDGVDYLKVSSMLLFSPGETQKSIVVTICNDAAYDANPERFYLNLVSPIGAIVGEGLSNFASTAGARARIDINDDDLPRISVDNASIPEPGGKPEERTIVLALAKAPTVPLVVGYSTGATGYTPQAIGGTACVGFGDFVHASGTITFAPGEREKKVPVTICGDDVVEQDDHFALHFTTPGGPGIAGPTSARITIVNDDIASLRINDATVPVDLDSPAEVVLTVGLEVHPAPNHPVAVNFLTSDGTLKGGASCDTGAGYVTKGGSLGFTNSGGLTQTITVHLCKRPATTSALKVILTGPINATIARGSGVVRVGN
jgi:hypothetical protein